MKTDKIVVIEDEPDILENLRFNLEREGFEVATAVDGVDGLAVVRREQPDLVLLDLLLPRRDGMEVCRTLKGDPATKGIPIIMVTAKGEETDIVLGLGLGADDYLTPTEFRLLLCLAAHPGRVFGRDYLVSRVIGEGVSVVERTIGVHVQAIRKKLGAQRELVETVRGIGYRLREES